MKASTFLTATAAFATYASARFIQSNGTHFTDPDTNQTIKHFGCGAHADGASHDFLKAIGKLHNGHRKGAHGSRAAKALTRRQVTAPFTVPTYFHILYTAAKEGTFTQDMATAQIQAMNAAYNPLGITFDLQGTTMTANNAWAVAAGPDMDAAKAALRTGTYGSLNIYFHSDFAGGNLGTCTLPSTVPPGSDPSTYVSDGCNVNANTMPGGTMLGYNMGGTAIHETGHWLGLLHTFEGYSCDPASNGDYIDDTPQESISTNGCPAKPAKDSCPSSTGVDPIHNYMDYSTDVCYEGFTPGQVARIESMWTQFRAGM